MPDALMLFVNALISNAVILLDKQRKNAADQNFVTKPLSQNAFSVLLAQLTVRNLSSARLICKGCTCKSVYKNKTS